MPRTLLARLVGSYHRPPAQLILENLPSFCPLILSPETDNPWDPNALKVLLDPSNIPASPTLEAELPNFGSSLVDLQVLLEIHLGYIAKTGGKYTDGYPGNAEVLELMAGCPNHTAILSFTPEGKPLVQVSEGQAVEEICEDEDWGDSDITHVCISGGDPNGNL